MENVEQEFLSVIREYERVIYKVCYLYTTPNATLNDLYQEVVLNIWKAFPKFRRECKISTWIYRIALNTCISFIRKEKNIPEIVTLTQEADRSEEDDETQAMLQDWCTWDKDYNEGIVTVIRKELLDMKQIGITLTENGAMYPHASVCGLMFSHPQSRYFAVGKIGEDQLEDYACRRGKPIEEMRTI